eukprot:1193600-Prymnesium_polylepis.1
MRRARNTRSAPHATFMMRSRKRHVARRPPTRAHPQAAAKTAHGDSTIFESFSLSSPSDVGLHCE